MEFQKYNVKKKKEKRRRRKIKRENKQTNTNNVTKIIKKIQVQNWYHSDIQCYIKEEEKETEKKKRKKKKSQKLYKKKNYRYKIDNIYQKAKIKNLE